MLSLVHFLKDVCWADSTCKSQYRILNAFQSNTTSVGKCIRQILVVKSTYFWMRYDQILRLKIQRSKSTQEYISSQTDIVSTQSLVKIPVVFFFFTKMDKLILKFLWRKSKEPRTPNQSWKRRSKLVESHFPNSKLTTKPQ